MDVFLFYCNEIIGFSFSSGLPSKSPEEAEKHKQEYDAMVEAAKKKGLHDDQN